MAKEPSLPEITAQIEKLQRQADLLRARHKKPVINSIIEAMVHYGITYDELLANAGESEHLLRGEGRRRSTKGRRVPPKYRNPKTGETWSGRGRTARWIAEAEAQGKSRDKFLIK